MATVLPPDSTAKLGKHAAELGESRLSPAASFKTSVYLGEQLVFKLASLAQQDELAKEVRVLSLLPELLPQGLADLVPKVVDFRPVDDLGWVLAETRVFGTEPTELTVELQSDLGTFLRGLHVGRYWDEVDEFDGRRRGFFPDYLAEAVGAYATRLRKYVEGAERDLVDSAEYYVRAAGERLDRDLKLVLVHKDLYLANVLVRDGRLSGVIDWAAAQTAPREWEFAILRQRLKGKARETELAYGIELDEDLLRTCGVLQALRFWKSFPEHESFVQQQVNLIREVLDHA